MNLIAISGKLGSGKDEIYTMIRDLLPKKSVSRLGFADSLKEELAIMLWPSCLGDYPRRMEKVAYINGNKKHFRLMLQGLGTDYRRQLCADDYWLDKFDMKLQYLNCDVVVVPDVRFENEYNHIVALGGDLWRVERIGEPNDHISEIELDKHEFDVRLSNTGTLSYLKSQVEQALKDRNFLK